MLLVLLQRVQHIWTKMPSLYNRFVTCNSFFGECRPSFQCHPFELLHLPHGSCGSQDLLLASCSQEAMRLHLRVSPCVAVLLPDAKGVIPILPGASPELSGGWGKEGCRFLTKGFLLCGKPAARLVASADRFARTPALTCSAELACWFSQTHVLAKGFASPLAGKAPYR
jgi:hypothetical protein